MSTGVCYLNDRDVETDFALEVMALTGWPGTFGSAPRDLALIEGPEMAGGFIDPRLVRQLPGRGMIAGVIEQASVAATLAKIDALKAVLSEKEIKVRTAFAPDRYCLATLETHDGDLYEPTLLAGLARIALTFTIKDGIAFRNVPDGYALSTTRTACPIGTYRSSPEITIHGDGGTLTNPSIVLRNSAGDVVQSMGFSTATLAGGVLGANDFLLVDSARASVTKSIVGVPSSGISLWTSGDFVEMKPEDGWVEGAAYPSVELSASAGTPKGLITYRRRYR